MFRSLFRGNRTIRVPVENSGHQVRNVRFAKSPLSTPSNFITTFFVAYVVYHVLQSPTGTKDGDEGQASWEAWKKKQGLDTTTQQDHQPSEHWKNAHEAIRKASGHGNADSNIKPGTHVDGTPPDVISTITLPIWIRPRKSQLYQPDDPEYKDFARIQSDKKKIADLKKQVADMALARLKNPAHEVNLKHIAFKGQVTVVLDLVPQLQPPPLYEVPALTLFKDGIGFGWKVLRPDLGTRLESVMRPSVTYNAAKVSIRTFFWTTYAITRAKLSGGNPAIVQLGVNKPSNPVMSQKDLDTDNAIPPMSQWPTNTQAMQELIRAVHNGDTTRERHTELIKNLPFSTPVQWAAATFRRAQLHGMMHAQQDSARGVIQVRGAVVCMGDRGKYRMDVLAFYLPSEDKFVGSLLVRSAYIVKDYNQCQKLEEEKKKKLLEAINQKRLTQLNPKPLADEHEHATQKPAAGKEED